MSIESPSADPTEMIERIRAGDPRAEAELVERFSRGLTLMLRHLAGDASLADDLHQETLVLVLEKARRGDIREPERLAGFVRQVARNLLIADRRKEKRYSPLGDDPPPEPTPTGDPAQVRRLLQDEEARQVRRLLGELRFERDRQLLLRFYLSDQSKEEIYSDLGIEPQRFRKVLHRARQRLRELWQHSDKRRQLLMAGIVILGLGFLGRWASSRHRVSEASSIWKIPRIAS